MVYSIIAFLITFGEVVAVVGSYLLHSHNILYNALVYGSPFYLLMNLLGSESALWDKNPLYLILLAFHIFKYFIIFRAQFVDDRNLWRILAIVFEAAYLCLSAYYVN